MQQPELPADAGQATIKRLDDLRFAKGDIRTAQIRGNLQRTMQNDAAVFRTAVSSGFWVAPCVRSACQRQSSCAWGGMSPFGTAACGTAV